MKKKHELQQRFSMTTMNFWNSTHEFYVQNHGAYFYSRKKFITSWIGNKYELFMTFIKYMDVTTLVRDIYGVGRDNSWEAWTSVVSATRVMNSRRGTSHEETEFMKLMNTTPLYDLKYVSWIVRNFFARKSWTPTDLLFFPKFLNIRIFMLAFHELGKIWSI